MSRKRQFMLLSFAALCAAAVLAAPASADASFLRKSKPAWYTAALDKKVQARGR